MNSGGTAASPGRFVYGLRVAGLDDVAELHGPTDHPAGGVGVRVTQSTTPSPPLRPLDSRRGVAEMITGHVLELDRAASRATFYGPAIPPDLLAHPYLGAVGVTFNRWAGREVFHAGAFINHGRAWILIGRRTAGKSTLTAALSARGVVILADDIVVTDGSSVLAGPRCIDLREPIPQSALTGPEPVLSPSRRGTRRRIALPPTASSWPLGGWFFLGWSDELSVEPLPISTVLRRLSINRCVPELPSDPGQLLTLAGHPGWAFRRPKAWSELPGTVETLLATAALESRPLAAGAVL